MANIKASCWFKLTEQMNQMKVINPQIQQRSAETWNELIFHLQMDAAAFRTCRDAFLFPPGCQERSFIFGGLGIGQMRAATQEVRTRYVSSRRLKQNREIRKWLSSTTPSRYTNNDQPCCFRLRINCTFLHFYDHVPPEIEQMNAYTNGGLLICFEMNSSRGDILLMHTKIDQYWTIQFPPFNQKHTYRPISPQNPFSGCSAVGEYRKHTL